jgi:Type II site-specific deoxyribonuclease
VTGAPSRQSDAELRALLASVSPDELRAVAPIVAALRRPVAFKVGSGSDLITTAFELAFRRRLQVFHSLNDDQECLNKKAFEFAFKAAMEAEGFDVVLASSATFPGADAVTSHSGKAAGFSLKTEAEKSISKEFIKISKLMESIWTKGLTTTDQFLEGLHHIHTHLSNYDRILTLRVFGRLTAGEIRYELWEIPRAVLQRISTAALADFRAVTKKGSTTLTVRVRKAHAFNVVFDGSDQKITISRLDTSLCKFHASWTLTRA